MSSQPTIKLNDGRVIPQLGLGVWQTPDDVAAPVVQTALEAGYRSVDTAAIYGNEKGVGKGLEASDVARDQIFVTTKLWNDRQGYDSALTALDKSLGRLGLDHVDLYLIHWPAPSKGLFVDSWKALIQAQKDGKAKSIGVSNFAVEHLERIVEATGVTPAVNQIELHPRFQQAELRALHKTLGIVTESWSPLGQGKLLQDPTLAAIARKHGKSAAQVVIRWHLDSGLIVIPKSVNADRIRQNIDVFDFTLDADDLAQIGKLDTAEGRIGPDPLKADF